MTSSQMCFEINLILARLPNGSALQAAGLIFLAEYRRDVLAATDVGRDRGIARALVRSYRRQLLTALQQLDRQTVSAGKGVRDA